MNLVDLAIVAMVVLAIGAGHQLGFLARVLAWAGLALGIAVGVILLPALVNHLRGVSPQARIVAASAFVFGVAVLGQALGYAAGGLLHARLQVGERFRRADRIAGAVLGGSGALVAVWLLTPAMAATPGWPARAARGSFVMRTVNDFAPTPPQSIEAAIGRVMTDVPFPEVQDPLSEPKPAGTPPRSSLSARVEATVAASTVKIEGQACDQIQDGSGWVVATDEIVTNAHVVAGERQTTVRLPDGSARQGDVVAFDSRRDLAIVRVPELGLSPLRRRDATVGTTGAVLGHPGGGDLRVVPARIDDRIVAVGSDIYRTASTSRDVLVVAARLAPGDSGGPLVDERGRVMGVAFAIDPAHSNTSYALTTRELEPVLASVREHPVATGSCLVD